MKKFRRNMLIIVGLVLAVVGLSFKAGSSFGIWAYPIVTIGGLIILAQRAISYHKHGRNGGRFNIQVASESLQALGVFFLLMGFAVSASGLDEITFSDNMSFKQLRPLIAPFIEGLVATGCATFLSTLLRQYQATSGEAEDSDDSRHAGGIGSAIGGSIHDILSPDDIQRINDAFGVVRHEVEGLQDSVRDVNSSMGHMNDSLRTSIGELVTLLQQVGVVIQDLHTFFPDPPNQQQPPTLGR